MTVLSRRSVTILGATGSVGRQALDVLEQAGLPFSVLALQARRDAAGLAEAAKRVRARYAVVSDPSRYGALKEALRGTDVVPLAGGEGMRAICALPTDWLLCAVSGYAAIRPLFDAIPHCRAVAIANKESLVCAGEMLTRRAAESGCALLPVDSEHSALFRLLQGREEGEAVGATLTASGGAFRDVPHELLAGMGPEDALKHPVWKMGAKITVDCATMMNKGLEIIEAHRLFPALPAGSVDAVIHRESLIHGVVHWRDGSAGAYISPSDMRIPVAQAWHYPDAPPGPPAGLPQRTKLSGMSFAEVCPKKYPCYYLALDALKAGGLAPTVLNVANEIATEAFLQKRIRYADVARRIARALEDVPSGGSDASLEALEDAIEEIRRRCLTEGTKRAAVPA